MGIGETFAFIRVLSISSLEPPVPPVPEENARNIVCCEQVGFALRNPCLFFTHFLGGKILWWKLIPTSQKIQNKVIYPSRCMAKKYQEPGFKAGWWFQARLVLCLGHAQEEDAETHIALS